VRLETASALKRDVPVIPVLVHGARMPRPDQLPDDLRDLAYRNCCELTHARWGSDLQLLVKALRDILETSKNPTSLKRRTAGEEAATQQAPVQTTHEDKQKRPHDFDKSGV
jgi:hypothetical protein